MGSADLQVHGVEVHDRDAGAKVVAVAGGAVAVAVAAARVVLVGNVLDGLVLQHAADVCQRDHRRRVEHHVDVRGRDLLLVDELVRVAGLPAVLRLSQALAGVCVGVGFGVCTALTVAGHSPVSSISAGMPRRRVRAVLVPGVLHVCVGAAVRARVRALPEEVAACDGGQVARGARGAVGAPGLCADVVEERSPLCAVAQQARHEGVFVQRDVATQGGELGQQVCARGARVCVCLKVHRLCVCVCGRMRMCMCKGTQGVYKCAAKDPGVAVRCCGPSAWTWCILCSPVPPCPRAPVQAYPLLR